ncbi:MAG TPA: PspC domain-containing protein, partial [Candidatus Acidoferrum sp.]|nr:PspC domain-containing protein [Candidatus Acidoferrum sp.]
MNERLFRSSDDRMLAGVAGGIAEAWDLDPSLVRIGWVVLTPLTAGFAILVYIVMAIVVPLEAPTPRTYGPGASSPAAAPSAFSWTASPPPASSAATGDVPQGPGAVTGSDTAPAGPLASGDASPGPGPSASPSASPAAGPGAVGGPVGPGAPGAPGAFGGPIGTAAGPAPGSSAWSDARRAERDARRADRHAARDARRAARGNGPGSGAIVGG